MSTYIPFSLCIIIFASFAHSQGQLPNTNNAAGGSDIKSSTLEGGADRIFNVNSDSVDMENGTMNWKGNTVNLGNSRIIKARFERYLASPTDQGDAARYVAILDQIQFLLSPQSLTKSNYHRNQKEAFDLLFKAAEFEIDAKNSLTIASQVQKAWRMNSEYQSIAVSMNQLETIRVAQEAIMINRAEMIEKANDERNQATVKGKAATVTKTGTGTTELAIKVKEEARTQARILNAGTQMTALALKAKLEFQSQMVAFLVARRFRHALIMSAFYRVIFNGSSQEIVVGAKEVKEFFPVSDFVPTLESIDSLSREAIKDVTKGMQTVEDLLKQEEFYGAFERLQETYFLGEFEPSVMLFPQEKKREMLSLWRDLRELQRLGDERDLANVENYLNKVRGKARDFPGSAILSKVNNAMNASNLSLLSAKSAALSGNNSKAEADLERAVKFWPLNPGIKDFATQVVNHHDTLALKVPEFDRLHTEGKWRDIFNKKLEYGLALAQDKERSDKLRKVIQRVGELDGNIQKAALLASQNNPYLAWDVIIEANKTDPDDIILARMRSDIAPLVAAYSQMIGQAERYEKEGAEAAALSAWIAAQDINPLSPICGTAIKRLSNSIAMSTVIQSTSSRVSSNQSDEEIPVPSKKH